MRFEIILTDEQSAIVAEHAERIGIAPDLLLADAFARLMVGFDAALAGIKSQWIGQVAKTKGRLHLVDFSFKDADA